MGHWTWRIDWMIFAMTRSDLPRPQALTGREHECFGLRLTGIVRIELCGRTCFFMHTFPPFYHVTNVA